ncbi:CHAP domain-containing protein [Candidatus Saccharibacteria bacterium]|nr:CHAP domain-containing protein [Candidatus Saccharibacteria bacterium]
MKNVDKVSLIKIVVAFVLLVGVSVVVAIMVNIRTGGEISKVDQDETSKVVSRDDTNEKKADESKSEPKGVTLNKQSDNNNESGRSSAYAGGEGYSYVEMGSSTNNIDFTGNSYNEATQNNDDNDNNITETDPEALAREEAERVANLQQTVAEQNGWYDVASIQNTYYWKNECPERINLRLSVYDEHTLGGYICESVSYAAWMAYRTYDVIINWGAANNWDDAARMNNYQVDHVPAVKTIGQDDNTPYGHVFWVEKVNPDGSIMVSEYNNTFSTQLYSGDNHSHDFGVRVIQVNGTTRYNYIHLSS